MPPSTRVSRGMGKYRKCRAQREGDAPKLKECVQSRDLEKLPALKDALVGKR